MLLKEKDNTKANYCSQYLFTETYHFKEYFNDLKLLNKNSDSINACKHQTYFKVNLQIYFDLKFTAT